MESTWLLELKHLLHQSTTQAALEHWGGRGFAATPYFNYRYEHIRQVERDAYRIWSQEGGDWEVIQAAVWIQDMFMPQFFGPQHAIKGAKWALEHLADLGFPANRVDLVAHAVALHDRRTMDIPAGMREARLVWDAEHLSHLGPAGMLKFMFCHTTDEFLDSLSGNPDYPEGCITLLDFAPALLEHRPRLYQGDWFYFNSSRAEARVRIHVVREFLDQLEAQLWHRDLDALGRY